MKKLSLLLFMLSIGIVVFGQNFSSGIGNPAGRSAPTGSLYLNNSIGTLWEAQSTTAGDWERVPHPVQLTHGFQTVDVADSGVGSISLNLNFGIHYVVSSDTTDIVEVPDSNFRVQEITVVYLGEADGGDTLVVTPDNLASWTTVLLDSPDEFVQLRWVHNEWHVILTTGAEQ